MTLLEVYNFLADYHLKEAQYETNKAKEYIVKQKTIMASFNQDKSQK